jgi:hypothetical protein
MPAPIEDLRPEPATRTMGLSETELLLAHGIEIAGMPASDMGTVK